MVLNCLILESPPKAALETLKVTKCQALKTSTEMEQWYITEKSPVYVHNNWQKTADIRSIVRLERLKGRVTFLKGQVKTRYQKIGWWL